MNRPRTFLLGTSIGAALTFSCIGLGAQLPQSEAFAAAAVVESRRPPVDALWQDRDVTSLDLVNGIGGKEHQPTGKLTFVEEDKSGGSPKFDVTDEQGVKWRAKLGDESKAETAATRLVWAAGYFTDEDYFLPEIRVENMGELSRGRQFVSSDGVVHGVRMERKIKGQKKDGNWSWFRNPLIGTREFNGLRVMMALINNWDLKSENNDIYEEKGEDERFVVADLGASFGRTGSTLVRSKGKLSDYRDTKFVQKTTPDHVDFYMSSRPFFLTIFDFPYYTTRTKMQRIVKHVPREDAKWVGHILARLSPEQIRDCFRGAGFSPDEVEGFAKIVEGRVAELNQL